MSVTVRKTSGETPETTRTPVPATDLTQAMTSLRDEMDRLFGNFFMVPFGRRMLDLDPFRRVGSLMPTFGDLTPRVDVKENEGAIEITVELPGLDEKDVEVKIDRGLLSITGEKKEEREDKTADYHLRERRYGSFHRVFRLPESVDEGAVTARFDKGVLTLTLPKTAQPGTAVRHVKIEKAA